MPQGDVGALGLALSGVLIVAAIALSRAQRLRLERTIAWAAIRAVSQLLAIGLALLYIIDEDQPIVLSWLWVVVIVIFATETVRYRTPEAPGIRWVALAAFTASAAVTLGVLFGLEIFPIEGRTVVPLAGMAIGNSMAATVLVARRIVAELRDQRPEVEVRLALGQSSQTAARPYVGRAVRTALTPHIERTKVVGVVSLPSAMVGLILAGVDPWSAVRVQVVVMYLVLGSVATTTAVVAIGLSRRLFTRDHRLTRLPREAAQ